MVFRGGYVTRPCKHSICICGKQGRVPYPPLEIQFYPSLQSVFVVVFDSLTWWGAMMALCMGRGDPYPSWRNYLVENGIKMTKKFCVSLGGLTLVVKRQYS